VRIREYPKAVPENHAGVVEQATAPLSHVYKAPLPRQCIHPTQLHPLSSTTAGGMSLAVPPRPSPSLVVLDTLTAKLEPPIVACTFLDIEESPSYREMSSLS